MKYLCFLVLGLVLGLGAACDDTPTRAPWKQELLDVRIDQLGSADRHRDLRVKGTIRGPFEVSGSGAERTITFSLVDGKATVRVVATGILPDRFREYMIGIVHGRWTEGMLHADELFVAAPEFPSMPKTLPP